MDHPEKKPGIPEYVVLSESSSADSVISEPVLPDGVVSSAPAPDGMVSSQPSPGAAVSSRPSPDAAVSSQHSPDAVDSWNNGRRRSLRRKHTMYAEQKERDDSDEELDDEEEARKKANAKMKPTRKTAVETKKRKGKSSLKKAPAEPRTQTRKNLKVAPTTEGGTKKRKCEPIATPIVTPQAKEQEERQRKEEVRAMTRWLEMILKENWPLSSIDDPEYRKQIGLSSGITFTLNQAIPVILEMNKLVVSKVSQEMKASHKGSILHAGKIVSTKFLSGVIASYMVGNARTQSLIAFGEVPSLEEHAKSVMNMKHNADGQTVDYSHVGKEVANYIREHVFCKRYGFRVEEVQKWLVCQTATSSYGHREVASNLGIPHVDCHSQLLSYQVNEMLEQTKDTPFGVGHILPETSQVIQALSANKNTTEELRSFLNMDLKEKDGWSSGGTLLSKFRKKQYDVLKVVHQDEALRKRCMSLIHSNQAIQQGEKMLLNLQFIGERLARKGRSLNGCRKDLQSLLDFVEAHHPNIQSHWYDHKLGTKYIHGLSETLQDGDFVRGVCKIQQQNYALLTGEEKKACQGLIKQSIGSVRSSENGGDQQEEDDFDFKAFVRRNDMMQSSYFHAVNTAANAHNPSTCWMGKRVNYWNCDFICGSSVGMDRVWSDAQPYKKKLQSESMSVDLFESILMLRYNMRLWGHCTVADAMQIVKTNNSTI